MPDLPNGKKCPKLPENESILPERVKLWAEQRAKFIRELNAKKPVTPPASQKPVR